MQNDINILSNIVVLIPSLNPTTKLLEYVNSLIVEGFKRVIIVNDGSKVETHSIFDELNKLDDCEVLHHQTNKGKGTALKTGLSFIQANLNDDDFIGVITADADGQHLVSDVVKIGYALEKNQDKYIIGFRNFDNEHMPKKNKLGNKLANLALRLFHGIKIKDSQTGLRAFPKRYFDFALTTKGRAFEYETNLLIHSKQKKIDLCEVQTTAVYDEHNYETTYHPLKDTVKIFWLIFGTFIKFSLSSMGSALVDLLAFFILEKFIFVGMSVAINLLISAFIARVLSSVVNYLINKQLIFKDKRKSIKSVWKYYLLWISKLMISTAFVFLLGKIFTVEPVALKLVVDMLLFFVGYKLQNEVIFQTSEDDI